MKKVLTKSVGVLLILLMIFSALAGCVNPEHTHAYEWVTDVEPTHTTPGIKHKECACGDKTEENTPISKLVTPEEIKAEESELVATLIEYLNNSSIDHDMIGKTLADKINDIKSGKQPLHIVVDPSSYYFVCAYYEGKMKDEYANFEHAQEYVWVKYRTIEEITEYYYDKNIITIFQINMTTYVEDILSDQADAPFVEQFYMLRPVFENETIITEPYELRETEQSFIYLNSSEKDEIYFGCQQWDCELLTIPCVYWEGSYYLYVSTHYINHYENDERYDIDHHYQFEEYYDALTEVMITDKYKTESETQTTYYGLIGIDTFVDVIRKENSNGNL